MGIDSVSNSRPLTLPTERIKESVLSEDTENTQNTSNNFGRENMQEKDGSIDLSKEKVEKMIEGLNEFLKPTQTSLKFQFHDKLNEFYVEIIDSETKEVVKEIPPKKLLDMYASMMERLGIFVDHKI